MSFFIKSSAVALAFVAALAPQVQAADYPTQPVKVIIAFKAGGAVDTVARTIGQQLQQSLGQPFVIDYRPGAATNIAIKALIDAPPDGHTLMLTANNAAINPVLFTPPPFDSDRDFAPVAMIGRVPVVLAAHPSFPANTPADLVRMAKDKPQSLNFGSPGNASTPHLAVELLSAEAGIKLRHVPYQGGAQALTDLMGGHIPMVATNALEAAPLAKEGRIKLIAALSAQRIATLPEVPTMAESGFPGFEATVWYGLIAPKATPEPILRKLHAAIQHGLQSPEAQNRMKQVGGVVTPGSIDMFAQLLRSERQRYQKVINEAGIKP